MNITHILSTAATVAAVLAVLPVAAQQAAPRCIDVKNIQNTISKDGGKTLTFTLRDGTTLVNHLQQPCDGLEYEGFVWATAPNGEVCETSQTLRVRTTGQVCRLGKFDAPVKTAPAPAR